MNGQSKVSKRNQITIPKSIVDALQLKEGDRVELRLREDGIIEVEPFVTLSFKEAKKLGYQREKGDEKQ